MRLIMQFEPFVDKFGFKVELEDLEVIVTGSCNAESPTNLQWCFVHNGSGLVYNGFEPEEFIQDWHNRNPNFFEVKKPDSKFVSLSARSFSLCVDCGKVVHKNM